jgi:hypothetical protein
MSLRLGTWDWIIIGLFPPRSPSYAFGKEGVEMQQKLADHPARLSVDYPIGT